jgi:hypothetical protein
MKLADNFDLKKFITEGRLLKEDQTIFEKRVQQYIKKGSQGDLDFSGTDIASLPDNLKVGGDLSLDNTPITSLPKGLEVEGNLDISYTKITSLPSDLKVGSHVAFWPDHPIFKKYTKDQIKKMVPGIKGNIF